MSIFTRRHPAHPDCVPTMTVTMQQNGDDSPVKYVHLFCTRDGQLIREVLHLKNADAAEVTSIVLTEHQMRGLPRA